MDNFEVLAGGGFAIVLVGIFVRFLLERMRRLDELVANHIQHSIVATQRMADAVEHLITAIERHLPK